MGRFAALFQARKPDATEATDTPEPAEAPADSAADEHSTPAPLAAVGGAVNDALVSTQAKVDNEQHAKPGRAESSRASEPEADPAIPGFVEWSATNVRRYVLGTMFVVSSVASVLTIFYAVQESSRQALFLAAVLVALATGSWWTLLSWVPTVVTIRKGILEVARGPVGEKFDLRDPDTQIELGGNVRSPLWKAVARVPDGKDVVILSSHVKPRQFVEIVQHHRGHAAEPATNDSEQSAPPAESD